jgi:hypothetical protein
MSRKIRLAPVGVEILFTEDGPLRPPSRLLVWTGGRTLQTLQEGRMDLADRRTGLDVWLARWIQAPAAGLLRETDLISLGEVVTGRHSGRRAADVGTRGSR